MYYILDGKTPRPIQSVTRWAKWFESADRIVERTTVGNTEVLTLFLGLDYQFDKDGPLLLFETLITNGKHDGDMWRYSTWHEAEVGHSWACSAVETTSYREIFYRAWYIVGRWLNTRRGLGLMAYPEWRWHKK